MNKKKSLNSFKLFGSWIGVGISYLIWLMFIGVASVSPNTNFFTILSLSFGFRDDGFQVQFLLATLGLIVGGFLVGWGIHLLIRKFKK